MKKRMFQVLLTLVVIATAGCNKEDGLHVDPIQKTPLSQSNEKSNNGALQIAGIGYFAEGADCIYPEGSEEPLFALRLTGDLEGCLFVFPEEYDCSPSGTYLEAGREHFIGTYQGTPGEFWTNYRFEAKYEDCANLTGEIFGRCQHPLVKGSGQGAFAGLEGRLDFKDDIEEVNFPYRGHFK